MPHEYTPQAFRPNKHKPSVALGPFGQYYQARGYDAHEHFHIKSAATWDEAFRTAYQWATEGYPEP